MCAAIARIDHPALSPVEISTLSPTVNILRIQQPFAATSTVATTLRHRPGSGATIGANELQTALTPTH